MREYDVEYAWVLRSKDKTHRCLFRTKCYGYFAERTSIKNPRFVTTLHANIKLFESRDDALDFYFLKMRAGHDVRGFVPSRKKIFINRGKERKQFGWYALFKNRDSFYNQR